MVSFKLTFKYPSAIEDNGRRQMEAIKKFPEKPFYYETFSEISLYFNDKLYRPSWATQAVGFSDSVWLLEFFHSLISKINVASKTEKLQSVWFVDNPIHLMFKKSRDKVKIWIKEEIETDPVEMRWSEFVNICVSNSKKFVATILEINKKAGSESYMKELIEQITIAEGNLAKTKKGSANGS